jgi:hypothetical protein
MDPLYPIGNHILLSAKAQGVLDPFAETREEYNAVAEQLLGLHAPAYTDQGVVTTLATAIAFQINFMVEQGIEPKVLRSKSNAHPGNTTAYRDRLVDPTAAALVASVTGRQEVGFRAPGWGV